MTEESNHPRWQGIFKVIEETAELNTILAKMCQRPQMDYWDLDLTKELVKEITDTLQAMTFHDGQ